MTRDRGKTRAEMRWLFVGPISEMMGTSLNVLSNK
jgi:hypothetical protein